MVCENGLGSIVPKVETKIKRGAIAAKPQITFFLAYFEIFIYNGCI